MIEEYLFSLFPSTLSLKNVHKEYNKRTIEILGKLISSYEEGVKENWKELNSLLSSLDINKKISPYFFYLKLKLAESLKNDDVPNSRKYIRELKNALIRHNKTESLYIKNIYDSPWDEDVFENRFSIDMDRTKGVKGEIKKLSNDEMHFQEKQIFAAIDLISEIYPYYSLEISELLYNIHLLKPEKEGQQLFYGASTNIIFGSIYFQIPNQSANPITYYFEHIIHEVSHLCLFLLFFKDKLILNDNRKIYAAPLREDKRHMYGIVHATFVLGRLVKSFQKLIIHSNTETNLLSNAQKEDIKKRLDLRELQFLLGYKTIKKHAKLTLNGENLINSLADLATEIGRKKNDL